jgi:hypothetical protein
VNGSPVRPLGVYAVLPNGDTIPIELTYTGWEDDTHLWDSITPIPPGGHLKVGMLPGHTSIRFPVPDED